MSTHALLPYVSTKFLRDRADQHRLYFRDAQGNQFRSTFVKFHRDGSVTILVNGDQKHYTEGTFYEDKGDLATLPLGKTPEKQTVKTKDKNPDHPVELCGSKNESLDLIDWAVQEGFFPEKAPLDQLRIGAINFLSNLGWKFAHP